MKTLSRLILLLLVLLTMTVNVEAVTLQPETLQYKVLYRWGMIHKVAGRATLRLAPVSNGYRATLTARSEPWADKIYHLRDTLVSSMMKETLKPTRYEKIAHEDGKFSHDIVAFAHRGNEVTGNCTRHRRKKGSSELTTTKTTLSATGMTVDMLSVFYYIRTLDFVGMKPGKSMSINIFSGKKKETLTITYHGAKSIEVGKSTRPAFYVTFTFTSDGKKSSDPIKAWISADSRRIPLKLEGSLKIGKVVVEYTGG